MKTTKRIILCLFSILVSSATIAFSGNASYDASDGDTITIHQIGDDFPGGPRSTVPFVAEYNELWNMVVLSSLQTCGNVSVTLESTAGDWYQTVFDTQTGSILIPVSGDTGHYTLTLQTSDGTVYQGEFDII